MTAAPINKRKAAANANNRGSNQSVANTKATTTPNNSNATEQPRKQTRAQRYFEEGTEFFLSGFGSSFNAMGTAGSDLDLTLIYPPSFTVDIQDLIQKVRKLFFKSMLRASDTKLDTLVDTCHLTAQAQVKKMVVISQARVPIIKFRDEVS